MMYSTGEISAEARQKPVGNKGEIGTGYIQGPRERNWVVGSQILTLTIFISGISTTRHLVLMPVFSSRGGRFQTMRRIQNWALGMRTSLHGSHIASISVASLTRKRFVVFIPWDPAFN